MMKLIDQLIQQVLLSVLREKLLFLLLFLSLFSELLMTVLATVFGRVKLFGASLNLVEGLFGVEVLLVSIFRVWVSSSSLVRSVRSQSGRLMELLGEVSLELFINFVKV